MTPNAKQIIVRLLMATVLVIGGVHASANAEERIAIRGYDPVAYFTESKPTVGDPNYQFTWDGAVYRFATARHLEMFKADPDRYVPQFGHLCTASLAEGRKFAGDPRYWLVRDGKLYLFGGPIDPDRMTLQSGDMVARAEANWVQMSRPSANRP